MKFIADFHVHSKFSRATARNLDLENLYIAARLKGITVVGTGDFTHPAWFSEIKEKLVPAEEGLFKLRNDIIKLCNVEIPDPCQGEVRFVLVSEISNIYKKDQKTRKNHHLVFAPDLKTAEKLNSKLDKIGNISSDGRPILGLDARDLLEIVLETSDQNYLIPAHIWTPWFSILGSKSGFDSIEECFEDLTPHIFAVETGLSSDPEMNWRVSCLDGLTLISNSDAHSPLKLGREANLFNIEPSFFRIREAIKTGDPEQFLGTFEFYPEEGKYHLDGHRKCNVKFLPKETIKHKGICPVCGKPLTLGVLYRIEELADRESGFKPENQKPYFSMIPLTEILSEIFNSGPGSKKVMQNYHMLLNQLGPEFDILHTMGTEVLEKSGVPLLGEAIRRMREKEIHVFAGSDGEFGKIKLFNQTDREKMHGQKTLFSISRENVKDERNGFSDCPDAISDLVNTCAEHALERTKSTAYAPSIEDKQINQDRSAVSGDLNADQLEAVRHSGRAILIDAGPGTGKTRTLTHRIAYLIEQQDISPDNVLALTFTNRAAQEMQHRLKELIPNVAPMPCVATFHSICLKIIKENQQANSIYFNGVIGDDDRMMVLRDSIKETEKKGYIVSKSHFDMMDAIVSAKQHGLGPLDDLSLIVDPAGKDVLACVYAAYQRRLEIQGLFDYEDLIFKMVHRFETETEFRRKYQDRFKYLFIDEYQDLNLLQYRFVHLLTTGEATCNSICVIGDPNQSIYGFRGSDIKFFQSFINDYPGAVVITLNQNYRSSKTIVDASNQIIQASSSDPFGKRIFSGIKGEPCLRIIETNAEKSEAAAVGMIIEDLMGGTGFHSIDFNKIGDDATVSLGFSDFAVLYRTGEQGKAFESAFRDAGIPFQTVIKERLFHEDGVSECLSFLKIIEGLGSYADLERVLKSIRFGPEKKTIEILKAWGYENRYCLHDIIFNARRIPIADIRKTQQRRLHHFFSEIFALKRQFETLTVSQKLMQLLSHPLIAEKANSIPGETLKKMVSFSERFGSSAFDFIAAITLNSDTDMYAHQSEQVSLMTMHAAKGLEFPVVFVTGCERGLLPFDESGKGLCDVQEERRLFYVSVTRAKQRLYITHAKRRRVYGQIKTREISPFVSDIDNRLRLHESQIFIKKKGQQQQQLF